MIKDNIFYNLFHIKEILLTVLLIIIYGVKNKNKYVKIVGIILLLTLLFFFRNNLNF